MAKLKFLPPQFNNYPPFNYFENSDDKFNFHIKDKKEIVLFMHIPFCMQKCGYCALSSVIRDPQELDPVIQNIKKEIDLYASQIGDRKVIAALLGGGTPSNLTTNQIQDLYGHLHKNINFDQNAEVTVEVRPNTIDEEKIKAFMSAGVNRISFGVQTLIPEELELCGRQNTQEVLHEAMEIVKKCGINNINFDIIGGLPKQTRESFHKTCQIIFEILKPNHVSFYNLIIHPATMFAQLYRQQPEIFPNDALKETFYEDYFKIAKSYGYVQTSTENVAINDKNCSHYQRLNWSGYERLSIGPEAIGFIGNSQYVNKNWKNGYLGKIEKGLFPTECSFQLNQEQLLRRRIILGLHNLCLNKDEIKNSYHEDIGIKYKTIWDNLKQANMVIEDDEFISLTDLGKKYLYEVQVQFYENYLEEGQRGLAGVTKR